MNTNDLLVYNDKLPAPSEQQSSFLDVVFQLVLMVAQCFLLLCDRHKSLVRCSEGVVRRRMRMLTFFFFFLINDVILLIKMPGINLIVHIEFLLIFSEESWLVFERNVKTVKSTIYHFMWTPLLILSNIKDYLSCS